MLTKNDVNFLTSKVKEDIPVLSALLGVSPEFLSLLNAYNHSVIVFPNEDHYHMMYDEKRIQINNCRLKFVECDIIGKIESHMQDLYEEYEDEC